MGATVVCPSCGKQFRITDTWTTCACSPDRLFDARNHLATDTNPEFGIYKIWCWREKPLKSCTIDELLDAHAQVTKEQSVNLPLGPLDAIRGEIKRRCE